MNNYKIMKKRTEKLLIESEVLNGKEHRWLGVASNLECDLAFILTTLEIYHPEAYQTITKSMEL